MHKIDPIKKNDTASKILRSQRERKTHDSIVSLLPKSWEVIEGLSDGEACVLRHEFGINTIGKKDLEQRNYSWGGEF